MWKESGVRGSISSGPGPSRLATWVSGLQGKRTFYCTLKDSRSVRCSGNRSTAPNYSDNRYSVDKYSVRQERNPSGRIGLLSVMEFRVISVRPRTTVGTVATGVAIVALGAAFLVVGATLLLGVAVIGATAAAATLVYRRLTGRTAVLDHGGIGPLSDRRSLDELARPARLGLDPRMEVLAPPADGTADATASESDGRER